MVNRLDYAQQFNHVISLRRVANDSISRNPGEEQGIAARSIDSGGESPLRYSTEKEGADHAARVWFNKHFLNRRHEYLDHLLTAFQDNQFYLKPWGQSAEANELHENIEAWGREGSLRSWNGILTAIDQGAPFSPQLLEQTLKTNTELVLHLGDTGHLTAEESDWRPNEILPEDYYTLARTDSPLQYSNDRTPLSLLGRYVKEWLKGMEPKYDTPEYVYGEDRRPLDRALDPLYKLGYITQDEIDSLSKEDRDWFESASSFVDYVEEGDVSDFKYFRQFQDAMGVVGHPRFGERFGTPEVNHWFNWMSGELQREFPDAFQALEPDSRPTEMIPEDYYTMGRDGEPVRYARPSNDEVEQWFAPKMLEQVAHMEDFGSRIYDDFSHPVEDKEQASRYRKILDGLDWVAMNAGLYPDIENATSIGRDDYTGSHWQALVDLAKGTQMDDLKEHYSPHLVDWIDETLEEVFEEFPDLLEQDEVDYRPTDTIPEDFYAMSRPRRYSAQEEALARLSEKVRNYLRDMEIAPGHSMYGWMSNTHELYDPGEEKEALGRILSKGDVSALREQHRKAGRDPGTAWGRLWSRLESEAPEDLISAFYESPEIDWRPEGGLPEDFYAGSAAGQPIRYSEDQPSWYGKEPDDMDEPIRYYSLSATGRAGAGVSVVAPLQYSAEDYQDRIHEFLHQWRKKLALNPDDVDMALELEQASLATGPTNPTYDDNILADELLYLLKAEDDSQDDYPPLVGLQAHLTAMDHPHYGKGYSPQLREYLGRVSSQLVEKFPEAFTQEPPDWRPNEAIPEDYYTMGASGGSPIRYAEEMNQSFAQSHQRSQSSDADAMGETTESVLDGLGLKAQSREGIVDWEGGSTNSIVNIIREQADPSLLEYAAAWQGLLTNQDGVMFFSPGSNGPDSSYTMELKETDSNAIRQALQDHGISHRTIIPGTKKTQVVIYDQDRAWRERVAQFAQRFNADVHETPGSGQYLGGSTRSAARRAYRDVIERFESSAGATTGTPPGPSSEARSPVPSQ